MLTSYTFKLLNKNTIKPKQIMFLCCVINFEQLLHIDVMLSSNIRSGEGGGLGGKNEMLSDVRGQGIVSVVDVQSLFFSLKKIGFGP